MTHRCLLTGPQGITFDIPYIPKQSGRQCPEYLHEMPY